jgi:hypothetical protein
MFPHVCHHRGDRLAYLADPETRARSPCNAQCIVLVSPSITSRTRGSSGSRLPLAVPWPWPKQINFNEFRWRGA